MVFGRLFRSNSDTRKRPGSRHRSQQQQRPHSIHVRAGSSHEAAAAYSKAAYIYEAEADQIMKDELAKRTRNDKECKRQMDGIQKRMKAERKVLDDDLIRMTNVAKTNYRAGKISSRELDKQIGKLKQQANSRWASFLKWEREEKAKAQRIFFARGEEIGANTGAALRRAREKKERNQRDIIY